MNRDEVLEEVAVIIRDNVSNVTNGESRIIAEAILEFLDSIGYDASPERLGE
jgi:hypothetical protein